ncbi:MAG: hypothetical protein LC802_13290 [Acidobacteria bacterium]|nr:hypothetical protein [Acidobacteriota bacterium]
MKTLISKLAVSFIWCALIPLYPIYANPASKLSKKIIVELTIEEFGNCTRRELSLDEGASRGGGGSTSSSVNISNYRYGLSVLQSRKKEATILLTMTLYNADGSEKKIDEQFLVVQGRKKEYRFSYGVKVRTYFSYRRKNHKDNSLEDHSLECLPRPTTHSTRLAISLPFIREVEGLSH